jgi:hypothetical protein
MSKLDVVDLGEAAEPVDYRSLRRLALGITAWFTVQLGFAAWLAVTVTSAWSAGNSIRTTAGGVGLIWIVADVVIVALLVLHLALKNIVKEVSS